MQGTFIPPEKRPLAAQLSDLVLFDFLTANPDRYSGGNIKMSPDGSQLYFMDNTMAFFLNPDGPRAQPDCAAADPAVLPAPGAGAGSGHRGHAVAPDGRAKSTATRS